MTDVVEYFDNNIDSIIDKLYEIYNFNNTYVDVNTDVDIDVDIYNIIN
jgi:hypothetical protein